MKKNFREEKPTYNFTVEFQILKRNNTYLP